MVFDKIIILGALGGRLDHTLANLSNLIKYQKIIRNNNLLHATKLFIVDNCSICFSLQPGYYKYVKSELFERKTGIGIFSMNGQTGETTTKGLKWDFN